MGDVIYAFSGDPITYGHINVIERALKMHKGVIVGIGVNAEKAAKYTFTLEERTEMARQALAMFPNVKVVSYEGSLVDFAYKQGNLPVIRGIRGEKDAVGELDMFHSGRKQGLEGESIFLPALPEFIDISSSNVKAWQVAQGLIHKFVPPYVKQCLEARLSGQYVIGITGEIGSGKSYVGSKLEELGKKTGMPVYNIDLDELGHRILKVGPYYQDVRDEISEAFGEKVKEEDGSIDRNALGNIVFSDPEALTRLNKIMHTPILVELRAEMINKKGLILLNAALIAESGMTYLCNNNTVLVGVDGESQFRRLKAKGLTKDQIGKRLSSQYKQEEKYAKLDAAVDRDAQGTIWTLENSDDSDPKKIDSLFGKIVSEMDIYGELRFRGLWERIKADATPDEEYGRLLAAYKKGHRSYHAMPHIVSGLDDIAEAAHLMDNPDQVMFAWYYHDFVQRIKSRVDEKRSAEAAYGAAKNALLSDEFADNVRGLCMVTSHNIKPKTKDEMYMADIDLSIFGRSAEEFDEYERKVREEYSYVPEAEFRERRAGILQRFLDRDSIYYTDFFKEKYETQARANLKRSIAKLRFK
ncbi:MAG: pantetheine-phosphate adenylyltransferase [archaeon]